MCRRFARLICTLCFGLTLLFSLLWVRSFGTADFLTLTTQRGYRDLYSELGSLHYFSSTESGGGSLSFGYRGIGNPSGYYRAMPHQSPWGTFQSTSRGGESSWAYPFWLLVFLSALPPGVWLITRGVPRWAWYIVPVMIDQRVMPGPLKGDAIHVAVAAYHGMEYVLSWNVKHLANPNKRIHLARILMNAGKAVPSIVTPEVLWEDEND